jgi:hypothetical protein
MNDKRNPWILSLAVFVVWVLIVFGGELLQAGGTTALDDLVASHIVVALVVAPAFLFAVVAYLKWWKPVGLQAPRPARSLLLLWLPVLYITAFLTLGAVRGLPSSNVIVIVLINALLVGISEELMFRGFLWHGASSRYSFWASVALTAAVFGGIHALNGIITGDFGGAVVQAIQAMLFGVWMLALRLRQSSIIPAMIIHGLWDFAVFTTAQAGAAGAQPGGPVPVLAYLFPVIVEFPLFLWGLWLLRGYLSEQAVVE